MLSRMVSTGLERATAVVEAARHNPQAAAVALGLGAAGAVALYAMTRKGEHLRPRRKAGQVHLVGSGVASLTAAVELVQHGIAEGRNIHIYEELKIEGGCLDGCGDAENGFVCRGGRMFDTECYLAVWDLIKRIPSAEREGKTVMQDYEDFNTTFKTNGKARLVRSGGINAMADGWKMGLSTRDKFEMVKMMACSEASLGRKGINEFFNPHFFKTPFWYMWSTTFAFQPWHSAVEFKRYMHKFQHEFPKMFDLGGVKRTKYNQYDSLALPLRKYLVAQGVQFHLSTCVVDAKFEKNATTGVYRCQRLAVLHPGKSVPEVINLAEADTAIFTVGSMTADATLGHTKVAPPPPNPDGCQSWSFKLWSKMALQLPREIVGNPANFLNRVPEAAWHSFTCTFKANTEFLDAMVKFTGNEPGTGALCTIIDSPWYMSTVIPKQPHFINQPEDCQVLWGYALNLDVPGKFVKKTIVECTGEEILIELMGHMNLWSKEQQERILKTTITIPCNMPYITSMFLTRDKTDRPPVVPEKADNFAFVGQYVEYPDDTVFTVDMSVRSAMMAVRGIFGVKELVVPKIVYINDPATLVRVVKASF